MSDRVFLCPHSCFESNWLLGPVGLSLKLGLMDLVSIFVSIYARVRNHISEMY